MWCLERAYWIIYSSSVRRHHGYFIDPEGEISSVYTVHPINRTVNQTTEFQQL